MDTCPLCSSVHAGQCARRWAELWLLLATQEEEEDLEVMKVTLEERIPKHIVEQTTVEQNVDVPMPQVMKDTRDDGGYSK